MKKLKGIPTEEEKEKEKEWENKNGGRSVVHQNLEVLMIVNSTWAWFPVKVPLPSSAIFSRQYCLTILHKPPKSLKGALHPLRGPEG